MYLKFIYSIFSFLYFFFSFLLRITLIVFVIFYFVKNQFSFHHFLLRHSQHYIYPVMRQIRLLSLPVIKKYPHLSNYHEEECLIMNPFFKNFNFDCWPCENLRSIINFTNHSRFSKIFVENGQPFVVKNTSIETITLIKLKKFYNEFQQQLLEGTTQFIPYDMSKYFENPSVLQDNISILWKMTRVSSARAIRLLFPRPYFIPIETEVSLQRYILIDGPNAPQYYLPLTEFSNVWLAQGQGYRLIVLDPSSLCKYNCSRLSIVLRPKDILYYNWQLYQPRSLPAKISKDISITYMGNFY